MDSAGFGHWLAGFADGEGCFSIRKQSGARNAYICEFTICLRDDDSGILATIAETTGLGRLSRRSPSALVRNAKAQVCWKVQRRSDTLALVETFTHYPLRSKKRHDFAVWSEAVRLWNAQSGSAWAYDDEYGGQMAAYEDAIRDARRYVFPSELAASVSKLNGLLTKEKT